MNNVSVVTNDDPLQPGQVRFYCAAQPALQAGGYWLQARQTVAGLKEQPADNQFGMQHPLAVSGPRFRLPPEDLQLVYPPANQSGPYEESLALTVLRTRTLPWVRQIDGGTAGGGADKGDVPPWIGLLTLYPDELQGAKPFTTTVERLIRPEAANILGPTLVDADALMQMEKDEQLLAIDLDLPVFRAISPQLRELPFLAHVREVNTDQKEVMNMVEDGWFSVIIGNRLPKTAAENVCFLVSLEGQQAHLNGGPAIPPVYTKIRLVCLASWRFTAAQARGSFLNLMQGLASRGGIGLLQPTHIPFPATLSAAERQAKEALEIGFLPMQNLTRTGESSTSWYRGPLSPVPTSHDGLGPYFYSDRAIHYDQSNGLFNMSYAAAWQIGQLLALSDPAFAKALFEWRIQSYQAQQAAVATEHLESLAQEANLAEADLQQAGVTPVLQSMLSKLGSRSATPPPRVRAHAWRDIGQLPGMMEHGSWEEGLEQGLDPLSLLYQHLYPQAGETEPV